MYVSASLVVVFCDIYEYYVRFLTSRTHVDTHTTAVQSVTLTFPSSVAATKQT